MIVMSTLLLRIKALPYVGHGCSSRYVPRSHRLSSTHAVTPLVRQHHKQLRQRNSRPRAYATTGGQLAQPSLADHVVGEQVATLQREWDTIRCHQLSASSSLAVRKLTALCETPQQQLHVVQVLAQHGSSPNDEGVFLLLVHLLFASSEASPGLAAGFLQALLTEFDGTVRTIDDMAASTEWMSLASQINCVSPARLLQLLQATNNVKVKTAALMLLSLKSAAGKPSLTAVSEAGAALVLLDELYQMACVSNSAHSNSLGSEHSVAAQHESKASQVFVGAAQHLLDELNPLSLKTSLSDSGVMKLIVTVACCATASSQLTVAAPPPKSFLQSIFPRLQQFLHSVVAACTLIWRITRAAYSLRRVDSWSGMQSSVVIRDQMVALQQALQYHMQRGAEVFLVSQVVGFYQAAISVDLAPDSAQRWAGVPPLRLNQLEKLTLARRIHPFLIQTLQHPQETVRNRAAVALVDSVTEVSHAHQHMLVSELLSSKGDVLGVVLKLLAGEDKQEIRATYAMLLGCLSTCIDAAGLKRILDAGAVQCVLQLLKESDSKVKPSCVQCLVVLTRHEDIRESVVTHGGTSILMDIAKAGITQGQDGQVQASTQDINLTDSATGTLGQLLTEPDAVLYTVKFGFPALLNKLAQCKELISPSEAAKQGQCGPGGILSCIYHICKIEGGKELLLRHLQPVSMSNILTLVLDWIESPSFADSPFIAPERTVQSAFDSQEVLMLFTQSPTGCHVLLQRDTVRRIHRMAASGSDTCKAAVVICQWIIWTDLQPAAQALDMPQDGSNQHGTSAVPQMLPHLVLLLSSPNTYARQISSSHLHSMVQTAWSTELCVCLHKLKAIERGVKLLQSPSESVATQEAVMLMFLAMHKHRQLPTKELIKAGIQEQLAVFVTTSDSREGLIDGAGHLLQALWQERPSLATEFVTKKHLPPLLKQLANFPNLPDGQVYIGMVQDIWSLTPALNAEPLLLETLDRLVEACSVLYTLAQAQAGDDEKQLMRDAQESSLGLLCSMARLPFYRPSIRKAEPAVVIAEMLAAGCRESDTVQQRTVAQSALKLVHMLFEGQLDGSDGPDAAHNTDFLGQLYNMTFTTSLLHMCKQGSTESQHCALTVLHRILATKLWHQASEPVRYQLIHVGLLPMLLEVVTSPRSAAETRRLAEVCLQSFQGDEASSYLISACGMRPLLVSLIGQSLQECREANQDHHSR